MITELPNGFIGVQVPEGAASFRIEGSKLSYEIEEADWMGDDMRCIAVHNTYNISLPYPCDPIGMANGLSEEQCEPIMLEFETSDGDGQIYYPNFEGKSSLTESAKHGFASYCRSLNIPFKTTFILKRKN